MLCRAYIGNARWRVILSLLPPGVQKNGAYIYARAKASEMPRLGWLHWQQLEEGGYNAD